MFLCAVPVRSNESNLIVATEKTDDEMQTLGRASTFIISQEFERKAILHGIKKRVIEN